MPVLFYLFTLFKLHSFFFFLFHIPFSTNFYRCFFSRVKVNFTAFLIFNVRLMNVSSRYLSSWSGILTNIINSRHSQQGGSHRQRDERCCQVGVLGVMLGGLLSVSCRFYDTPKSLRGGTYKDLETMINIGPVKHLFSYPSTTASVAIVVTHIIKQ